MEDNENVGLVTVKVPEGIIVPNAFNSATSIVNVPFTTSIGGTVLGV
jgi:hypothetical protein